MKKQPNFPLRINFFVYFTIFFVTGILGFFLLPLITGDSGYATLILIFILLVLGSAASFVHGFTGGYTDIIFCLTISTALLPALFIYMGSVALVYALAFFVITSFFNTKGMLVGWKYREKTKKENTH